MSLAGHLHARDGPCWTVPALAEGRLSSRNNRSPDGAGHAPSVRVPPRWNGKTGEGLL